MSYKTYYKLSSFILLIVSFALLYLIIQPFVEAESSLDNPKDDFALQDELRMHRNLYLEVSNSANPVITSQTKESCKSGLTDIDTALYSNSLSPEQEILLRKRLNEINTQIAQTLNLDSYSTNQVSSM